MRASRSALVLVLAVLLPALLGAPALADRAPRSSAAACPSDRVSTTAQTGYVDVAGHQFETDISCVTDYGLARGSADGRFQPASPVQRGQMALFLTRLVARAGAPLSYADAGFADLGTLSPEARDAVNAVAHLGITQGVGPGRFAPGEPVTRGQMASFLARTHRAIAGADLPPGPPAFSDDDGLVHEPAVDAVAHAGIAAGTVGADGRPAFAPERFVTRAQMAAFLARTLAHEVEQGVLTSAYDDAGGDDGGSGSPPQTLDRFTADGVRCTVVGTESADVLEGTSDRDVLCGLGGDDVLRGGAGDDVLDGGPGEDHVDGDDGSDDLDGGPDADRLDGGLGDNFCVPADVDVLQRCRYDETPPTLVEGSVVVTPGAVDVTDADVPVTLDVRLVDDTGVSRVQAWLSDYTGSQHLGQGPVLDAPVLVSGDVRDGVWRFETTALRYSVPGSFDLDLSIMDRVGREGRPMAPDVLVVEDATPDVTAPEVLSVDVDVPGGLPVDVRTSAADVTVTARVTDDLSGVGEPMWLCLERFSGEEYLQVGACAWMDRVSGTPLDGAYAGTLTIPEGSAGGDWAVTVLVHDRVRHPGYSDMWMATKPYELRTRGGSDEPRYRLLPDGAGEVPVLGGTDTAGPVVTGASATPDRVDTLFLGQKVVVTVDATDADGLGVEWVGARLQSPEGREDLWLPLAEAHEPTLGTRHDGSWTLVMDLPRGLPPGVYHLEVWIKDQTHFDFVVSPGHPRAGEATRLPEPVTVTVLESPVPQVPVPGAPGLPVPTPVVPGG